MYIPQCTYSRIARCRLHAPICFSPNKGGTTGMGFLLILFGVHAQVSFKHTYENSIVHRCLAQKPEPIP